MKTLQNNFTTPEQSKRLLELGVPADSADCTYVKHVTNRDYDLEILKERSYSEEVSEFEGFYDYLPCWSVGRLIEIFDMCYQREPEESITEHWILTQEATENFGSYIEYLVQTFCVQKKFLDFSKLED